MHCTHFKEEGTSLVSVAWTSIHCSMLARPLVIYNFKLSIKTRIISNVWSKIETTADPFSPSICDVSLKSQVSNNVYCMSTFAAVKSLLLRLRQRYHSVMSTLFPSMLHMHYSICLLMLKELTLKAFVYGNTTTWFILPLCICHWIMQINCTWYLLCVFLKWHFPESIIFLWPFNSSTLGSSNFKMSILPLGTYQQW